MRQSTRNEHAVQSQRLAVFCAYHFRFIRGGGGRQRLSIPSPSLGDRARFLLLPFSKGGRTEGWGKVVPGDFTLFEASVFRYCRCHPRGFSLLLHRHLPPSPVGRAGKPGKGVVVHWRFLSAGTRFPETAASVGAESPARTRAAQPGHRPLSGLLLVFLCSGQGVTARRWTLQLGHTGKRERGQLSTSTSHRLQLQEAQSDPDANRQGPEVTQTQSRSPGGVWV